MPGSGETKSGRRQVGYFRVGHVAVQGYVKLQHKGEDNLHLLIAFTLKRFRFFNEVLKAAESSFIRHWQELRPEEFTQVLIKCNTFLHFNLPVQTCLRAYLIQLLA